MQFYFSRHFLIGCCLLILVGIKGYGQDLKVQGVITDIHGEPTPYAHVYIADSTSNIYIGTVSDLTGAFEIQIPNRYADFNLSISCVGFELFTIPVEQALKLRDYTLTEYERLLSTVVLMDLSAKDIIRKGIDNLSENYMDSKFMNQYYNWKGLQMDTNVVDFQERFLTIEESFSNQKGTRSVVSDSLCRGISFPEIVVADEIYELSDNLYFDLIKSGAAIFNAENFSDWEFRYHNSFDSTGNKDVVIQGNRLGRKGFNQLIFYIDLENFAFKRVDFSYQWEDTKILNKKVNDSLYYSIDRIEGVFLYERTAIKYNVKYQFLKVDYSFQYRSVVWNHSNKKFRGVYVEEMNVLCSAERHMNNSTLPCRLEPIVVNREMFKRFKH